MAYFQGEQIMALNRLTQLGVFCVLVAIGCACGDDDSGSGGDEDGGTSDASQDDPDAAAGGPSQTGRIIMVATRFAGFDARGEGLLLNVDVRDVDERLPYAYEEAPGSPFGCKVTEFTPAEFATPPVNFGTLDFTIESGPAFPTCNFVEDVGYACVGAMGAGGDITVINTANGIYQLTNPDVTFGAAQVGRHIRIQGATEMRFNNGLFPVVDNGGAGDNTIRFIGVPGIVLGEADTAATYQVLAGFGPAAQTDPVPDDARVMLEVTAGGDGTFADFELDAEVGDSFTPDDDTSAILGDIPLDGSAFSFSCDGAGGDCNQAMANGAIIVTTDGPTTMLPGFVLPPPVTKAVQVVCLQPGGSMVNITAEASAFLMDSGATRIRALYARANVLSEVQAEATLDLAAGHAIAGFTNP